MDDGCSGASPTGVAGVTTPALLKTAGVDPRRNWDISVSFFLKRIKCLHFPTVSKIK